MTFSSVQRPESIKANGKSLLGFSQARAALTQGTTLNCTKW